MFHNRSPVWLPAVLAAFTLAAPAPCQEGARLAWANFEKVRQTIRPSAGEARWADIDWMPATNIWAARQKAAALGKPLFLWYMAGEPLGTC